MALSEADKEFLESEIEELEATLSEQKNTAEGLAKKAAGLEVKDKFYRRQYNKFNSIIVNYEKEIEGMNGKYVIQPIQESDLVDHANEGGRLYQGLISTKPKTIQQFNGLPLGQKSLHETSNFIPLLHVIDTFLNGEDGGPTFTPTTLQVPYNAGDATFTSNGAITTNQWYLLGKDALVKVGSVQYNPPEATGSCSDPAYTDQVTCEANMETWTPGPPTLENWVATITERYFLPNLDASVAVSGTIETWGGFSNTERTNKTATSTTQRFFNALLAHLQTYMTRWQNLLGMERGALNRNTDENMNTTDKQTTLDLYDYVVDYNLTTPLNDGTPGIDELQSQIAARQAFIPGRLTRADAAKAVYYGDRINFSQLRVDTQSGSLSRLLFVKDDLQPSFPLSGNPNTTDRIRTLKALLAE